VQLHSTAMPPSDREPSPFPIAHRAGTDLSLLSRAESLGLPLVEADVHLFAGRLEVRHLKTLGPVPVLWDRWELANPFAPRLLLDELLAAAAADTELMLDLKGRDPRLAPLVLEAVAAAGRAATSVFARAWPLLDAFREAPGIRCFHSIGGIYQLQAFERRYTGTGVDAVSIHTRLLDAATVARLQRLAATVVTWPVVSLAQARRLGSWGVSGVITDDLELARALLLDRADQGHELTGITAG
jgi:glycerophosphoryl diester phosphodiesterase